MALTDRQKEFAGYLNRGFTGEVNLPGWSLVGACAVAGNATQENLVQPTTAGPKDHGSDGVLQWRLSRLTDMEDWCGKHFGNWQTLQAQAAFTLYETGRDYPALDARLRAGALSIGDLATEFNRQFERSADDAALNAKRIKYAKDTLALMTKAAPPSAKSVTAAAGGVVAAIAAAGSHILTPQEILLGGSLFANGLLAFLIYELGHRMPAAPAAPAPKPTDVLTLAIAEQREAQAKLDAAKQGIAAMVAELQKQITEAEGLIK
jgi:hypothetical protein